ncbi:hypothetical protein SAY87_030929 [Trapa incisa]|uniref:RWP-RK domain-containing protein n=1 Tax=Trapa incisa TaxID=236973 RepID=A0AAN7KP04_9MYRT|nr:hypothetical protein SAY87_030929 [Trapa incisa]
MGDPEQSVVPDLDSLDVSSFFTTDMNSILSWNPLAAIHSSFLPLEPNINPGPCLLPSSTLGDYQGFHHHPGAEPVAITEQATVIPFSDQSAWSISLGDASLSYGGGPGFDPVASAPTVPDVSIASGGLSAPTQNVEYDNQSPSMLFSWPPPATPFVCSCCQVLREIIHIHENNHYTKLELHGRTGMIFHAILQDLPVGQPNSYYQMIDFRSKSLEDVKKFLQQYCDEKTRAGYRLKKDPYHMFYEAVCVGLFWNDFGLDGTEAFLQQHSSPAMMQAASSRNNNVAEQATGGPPEIVSQSDQSSGPVPIIDRRAEANPSASPALQNTDRSSRTNSRPSLAVQRERTAKMTLEDFAYYFHLPLDAAAEILDLSPTVIKKICRRRGLRRWPYRKVRSLKKQIRMLRERLPTQATKDRQHTMANIESLQKQISSIRYGVSEPPEDEQQRDLRICS